RILQESLTNIARHSKAKQVRINLEKTGNNILLMIQDDGIGFNKTSKKNGRAFGLLGINERVAMLNGQSSIETAPGRGTNIIVVLPLH
ncbi:MAG: sensor histidine kinase, partial [Chitinophagaceae bacterium]|nr:sensor histidine kinase [Chitinophagaceae bacterium]